MKICEEKLISRIGEVVDDFVKNLVFTSIDLENYETEILTIAALELMKATIKKDIENYDEKEALAFDLVATISKRIEEEQQKCK